MHQPSLIGPAILIVLLITLPLASIGDLIQDQIGWQPLWLIGASIIAGMEAFALRMRMLAGLHEAEGGTLRYLAAEIFALVVLARLVATLGFGGEGIRAMMSWITDPLAFFDVPFLICLLALTTVVMLSRSGIAAIAALTPNPPQKMPLYTLDVLFYNSDAKIRRWNAVKAIISGVSWGGLLIIWLQSWRPGNADAFSGWIALYLIGGLSLIELARRRASLADWQSDGAEVAVDVRRSWRLLSVMLIGLMIVLALVFPFPREMSMPEEWRRAIYSLVGLVIFIGLIASLLFVGLISLIMLLPMLLYLLLNWLLTTNSTSAAMPIPQPPLIPPATAGEPLVWPGLIFWFCVAVLTVLAFWRIARRQTWLKVAWVNAVTLLTAWWHHLRHRRIGGWPRWWHSQEEIPPPPHPRRSRSGPVDTVIACYHAALRHATARGYPRQPPQTPAEYAERFSGELPAGAAELQALTEAYQRVVYAGKPFDRSERRQFSALLRRFRRKV
ncbi:MAG: hypothetical protein KatS3mg056_1608 [Chloroflexus sp.]|nr:MAG: hypothetical protein KatS3mg056_1608 [Chloroflexus sp.]